MKTIIAGSRDFCGTIEDIQRAIANRGFQVTQVVSGGCRGVDERAEAWALSRGMSLKVFPADWIKHGKAAGPIRNRQMAEYAEALIAIKTKPVSRGTDNMIDQAHRLGLHVVIYNSF